MGVVFAAVGEADVEAAVAVAVAGGDDDDVVDACDEKDELELVTAPRVGGDTEAASSRSMMAGDPSSVGRL